MTRLQWCYQQRPRAQLGQPGRGMVRVRYTDLVPLADVAGPVFLQPDASAAGTCLYNHFVRG